MHKSNLFLVSAPSGTGKSTLINSVLDKAVQFNFPLELSISYPRSSRRRRSTNPPPSGKLIVRYSLFRQGKVRMSSTKGRHLLSPWTEDIAVDHGPAGPLAAPWSTHITSALWLAIWTLFKNTFASPAPFSTFYIRLEGGFRVDLHGPITPPVRFTTPDCSM